MSNQEISEIFAKIAFYLEIIGEDEYRVRAYERASQTIASHPRDVTTLTKEELEKLPGIGEGLAKKIIEYKKTKKIKFYEELKKKIPIKIDELMNIEGLGPKRIKTLYKELGVKNLETLEKAAQLGRIKQLEGFGEKTEQKILRNLETLQSRVQRRKLVEVIETAQEIERTMNGIITGSYRRRKETVHDLDLLVASNNPSRVINKFVKMKNVEEIINKGTTKSTVKLENGLQVDLRVVKPSSYGAAMQYFTGSKEHNIALRKIALKKNLKLNEYGLYNEEGEQIAGKTEEEIYEKLGLKWIPPELRENRGEIKAAQQNKLPTLIRLRDLRGDLHTHTKWSDGINSAEEMIQAAQNHGLEYVAITDHAGSLSVAKAADDEKLLQNKEKIERIRDEYKIKILYGCELDIEKNGEFKISDKTLEQLDFVIVSVHSNFNQSREKMTQRILKAVTNPYVHCFAHPTSRLINKRKPINYDFEKIMSTMINENKIFEINSQPNRLDLDDSKIKTVIDNNGLVSINSDAHSTTQYHLLKYGVWQARRGWATKKNVVNSWKYEKLKKTLKL